MASKEESLLKQSLYVYDLPPELLSTLKQKTDPRGQTPGAQETDAAATDVTLRDASASSPPDSADGSKASPGSASCTLCGVIFGDAMQQRQHVKSDWHGYNTKQRMHGRAAVNEPEFERLLETLDESISGSDTSSSEDDDMGVDGDATKLSVLLKKQARLQEDTRGGGQEDDEFVSKKRKRGVTNGSPLIWFTSTSIPDNVSLGVYRAILTPTEQTRTDVVEVIRNKQLQPSAKKSADEKGSTSSRSSTAPDAASTGPTVLICMIGGGHFAAMIVSLTPEIVRVSGVPERRAKTIAQKTFHRYTTRRKQGGAQSSNDNAKGPANSAGAAIRRANEAALESDIRNLLKEWKHMIDGCELLFVRASGTTNRRVLFGQHEGQVLKADDPRVRTIPFGTRRATQQECMRAFVELTRMKISRVDLEALAAAEAARVKAEQQKTKAPANVAPKIKNELSPEEEESLLHTSQIQALIRRSRVPALLSYFTKNSVSPDFRFTPSTSQANHHASTPLHLSASLNSPLVVTALLVKAGANPSLLNGEGKVAFDIAGDRATRDAFRVARSEIGESKWSWSEAHVPAALTKAEADQRDKDEKAQEAQSEAARRKADLQRLESEDRKAGESRKASGRVLGSAIEVTAADKREQEARGLTPEMRMKLERERRARAAEERMRKLAGK